MTTFLSMAMRAGVAALALVLALAGRVRAAPQFGEMPTVEPATYRSPSGEWQLRVEPSSREGAGSASYELHRHGTHAWSAEKELTLCSAALSDGGHAVGYGYPQGLPMPSCLGPICTGPLVIAVLDRSGGMRWVDSLEETVGIEVFLQPELRRFVVQSSSAWHVYGLPDGENRGSLEPNWLAPGTYGWIQEVIPLRGTPLVLVRGRCSTDTTRGARFAALDADLVPVWSLDLPSECTTHVTPSEEESEPGDALVIRGATRSFGVRHAGEGLLVLYDAEPDSSGRWRVRESSREESAQGAPAETEAAVPELALAPLGAIDLSAGDPPPPSIENVGAFAFDGQGNVAFLPAVQLEGPQALTLVSRAGEVQARWTLPEASEPRRWWSVAWDGSGAFLLLHAAWGERASAEIWKLDERSGEASRLPADLPPGVEKVEAFADGGFVLESEETLYAFDRDGSPRWKTGFADGLSSVDDFCALAGGTTAVLDRDPGGIHFVGPDGEPGRYVHLDPAPEYATSIAPGAGGGVIVVDSPSAFRYDASGKSRGILQPRYGDGRTFHVWEDVRADGEGRLWTTDRYALLRLDDDGGADVVLGEAPNAARLGDPSEVVLDRQGRIYAVAERTATVHVFDATGKPLHRCVPDPRDFQEELRSPSIAVDSEGEVFLSDTMGAVLTEGSPSFVRFSADGKRLGTVRAGFDEITESWYGLPERGERLVLGYEKAAIVTREGSVVQSLYHGADGSWLKQLSGASVAPDGSFALLSEPGDRLPREAPRVDLYSKEGEPLRRIVRAKELAGLCSVAFDGQFVVLAGGGQVHLFDARGFFLGRVALPTEETTHWRPLLPQQAHEVWLFDRQHTIRRFALP